MTPLIDADNYFVGPCGVVYAKERTHRFHSKRYPNGVIRKLKAQVIKPCINGAGYATIGYTDNNGCRKVKLLHRMVAELYVPNPDSKPEVNHKDLNKENNHHLNLEWVTRKENLQHAEDNGAKLIGSAIGTSKLREKDVLEIVALLGSGYSQVEVASMYGVTNHAIFRIAHGYNWSHLTGRKVGEE